MPVLPGVIRRFMAVSFSFVVVMTLELWYLGRQLTAGSASRQAKKKYVTLPEGVVMPPRLGRTLSSMSTATATSSASSDASITSRSTSAGDFRRTPSAGLTRSLSNHQGNTLGSTNTVLGAETTSAAAAAAGGGGAGGRIHLAPMTYSTSTTSSGFGEDSLLVTKVAFIIAALGAFLYFPWWLLLLVIIALVAGRYYQKRMNPPEEDDIDIMEIPRLGSKAKFLEPLRPIGSLSSEGQIPLLPPSLHHLPLFQSFLRFWILPNSLFFFFISLLIDKRAALVSKMKPLLKQTAIDINKELEAVRKANPAK